MKINSRNITLMILSFFIGSAVTTWCINIFYINPTVEFVSNESDNIKRLVTYFDTYHDRKHLMSHHMLNLKDVIIYDMVNGEYDTSYVNQFKYYFDLDDMVNGHGLNKDYRDNLKNELDSIHREILLAYVLINAKNAEDSLNMMMSKDYKEILNKNFNLK